MTGSRRYTLTLGVVAALGLGAAVADAWGLQLRGGGHRSKADAQCCEFRRTATRVKRSVVRETPDVTELIASVELFRRRQNPSDRLPDTSAAASNHRVVRPLVRRLVATRAMKLFVVPQTCGEHSVPDVMTAPSTDATCLLLVQFEDGEEVKYHEWTTRRVSAGEDLNVIATSEGGFALAGVLPDAVRWLEVVNGKQRYMRAVQGNFVDVPLMPGRLSTYQIVAYDRAGHAISSTKLSTASVTFESRLRQPPQ
jgi:hypothetical protein